MSTVQLVESAPGKLAKQPDGTYKIVLITPGLGSTGEYSEEVIRAYCAEAWPAGSHSYVDHPTPQNPGRSPKNLIGTLAVDAFYEDGIGAVSFLKPKKHWESFIEEVAPDCGMSIYAQGTGEKEMREGREVTVVQSFVPSVMNSVDLVSYAGRGGKFTESAEALFESALDNSAQSESSAGTDEKDTTNMAILEDVLEKLSALSDKFDTFVSEQATAAEAVVSKEAEAVESAKAVESAIAATKAVESAEVSRTVKDELLEGIKAGNYDVTALLERAENIRKETLAEAEESLGGRAPSVDPTLVLHEVKGW